MHKENKFYFLILVIFFPYFNLFALFCIFSDPYTNLMEKLFFGNGLFLLLIIIVLYIIALIFSVFISIRCILLKVNSQNILRINLIIKLIHIPAYTIIFFIGLASLITIFTMGISIVLIILDGLTIFMTGLLGLAGIIRGVTEKKITKGNAIMYSIFQFVFCADILSSILIYRKVKKENGIIKKTKRGLQIDEKE